MGAERQTIPIVGPPERKGISLDGHRFTLTGWTPAQWEHLTDDERPADAWRLGSMGWFTLRPEGDGPAKS